MELKKKKKTNGDKDKAWIKDVFKVNKYFISTIPKQGSCLILRGFFLELFGGIQHPRPSILREGPADPGSFCLDDPGLCHVRSGYLCHP